MSLPENSTLKLDDKIEITVEVTNTGSVSGKDVVELYYTAPYYENGIEKSAVNLAVLQDRNVKTRAIPGSKAHRFRLRHGFFRLLRQERQRL